MATKRNDPVKIRGPKVPGRRVLRPATSPARPKSLRFYNPDGEAFVVECPLYWARQLVASGDVELVIDEPAPKPAPKSAPKHEVK